jgi:hypothetical protein
MNLPKPAVRASTGWQQSLLQNPFIQPLQHITAVKGRAA